MRAEKSVYKEMGSYRPVSLYIGTELSQTLMRSSYLMGMSFIFHQILVLLFALSSKQQSMRIKHDRCNEGVRVWEGRREGVPLVFIWEDGPS